MGFPLRDIFILNGEIAESAPKLITLENGLCKSNLKWLVDDHRIIISSDDEIEQWKRYGIYSSPLSKFIKNEIEDIAHRAESVTKEQEQQIKKNLSKMFAMGGKEYLNVWKIKDKKLYLEKILGGYKLASSVPIFAEWYSGEIYIGKGVILSSEDSLGYISIYEEDVRLEINNGFVAKNTTIDNRKNFLPKGTELCGPITPRRITLRRFLDLDG